MMKRYITQAKEELEQIVDFLLLNEMILTV